MLIFLIKQVQLLLLQQYRQYQEVQERLKRQKVLLKKNNEEKQKQQRQQKQQHKPQQNDQIQFKKPLMRPKLKKQKPQQQQKPQLNDQISHQKPLIIQKQKQEQQQKHNPLQHDNIPCKKQLIRKKQQQQKQTKKQQQQQQQQQKPQQNDQMARQDKSIRQQQQQLQTQRQQHKRSPHHEHQQQHQIPVNHQQQKQLEEQERQRQIRQQQQKKQRELNQKKEDQLINYKILIKQLEKHQQKYNDIQKQLKDQKLREQFELCQHNKQKPTKLVNIQPAIAVNKENIQPGRFYKSLEIVNSEFLCQPLSLADKSYTKLMNKFGESALNGPMNKKVHSILKIYNKPVLKNEILFKKTSLSQHLAISKQIEDNYSCGKEPTTSTNNVIIVKTPKVTPGFQNCKSNKLIMPNLVDKVVFSNSKPTMNKVNATCLKSIRRVGTIDISKPTNTKCVNMQCKIPTKMQENAMDVHFASKTISAGTKRFIVKTMGNIYDPQSNMLIGQTHIVKLELKPTEQQEISVDEQNISKEISVRSESLPGIGSGMGIGFRRILPDIRPKPAQQSYPIPASTIINRISNEELQRIISEIKPSLQDLIVSTPPEQIVSTAPDQINSTPREQVISTPESPQYEFDLKGFMNSSLDIVRDMNSSTPPPFLDFKYFDGCNDLISPSDNVDLYNLIESNEIKSKKSIDPSSETSHKAQKKSSDKRSSLGAEHYLKLKAGRNTDIPANSELDIEILMNEEEFDSIIDSMGNLSSLMSAIESGDGKEENVVPLRDSSTPNDISTINSSDLMEICEGNDMNSVINPHTLSYSDINTMKLSSFEIDTRDDTRNDIEIVNKKPDISDGAEIPLKELANVNRENTEHSIAHSFNKTSISQETDSDVYTNTKTIQSINDSNAFLNPEISENKGSHILFDPYMYLNRDANYHIDVRTKLKYLEDTHGRNGQDLLKEGILDRQAELDAQTDIIKKKKHDEDYTKASSTNKEENDLDMLQEDNIFTEHMYKNLPRYELEELSTELFEMENDTNIIKDTNFKKYLKEESEDPIWGVRQYGSIC